jgi:hypothetical protein
MGEKWVKKSNGEQVLFDASKLKTSLFRAGANEELIDFIVQDVMAHTAQVTTTKKIYNQAYAVLKRSSSKLAGKYRLKNAILQLGPSGYPLEHYIGHLIAYQGLEREVGIMMQGKCLEHEVDVYGKNGEHEVIIECKHHSQPGYKSDVKVAMYVHARFHDIINGPAYKHRKERFRCMIATNTRFTSDAIAYAGCYQIGLISWDYPKRGCLRDRIEISGLYPITCLYSLTKNEKQKLLKAETVLCKELIEEPHRLNEIDQRKHAKILAECHDLLSAD